MILKLKSFQYKYLFKTILVIFKLKKLSQLYNDIIYYFKISKFFLISILYKEIIYLKYFFQSSK